MTTETITPHTVKGKAINELQNLTSRIVSGDAAATDIPVTGVTLDGTTLVAVHHYTTGAALADLTSEASVTSDGNIQLSTTDTTGDQLIVWFFQKP